MTKQTAFYVAIFSATTLTIGWYARGWREARSALITTLKRAAALSNERDRFSGTMVLIAVVAAVVLYVVATNHK